MWGGAVRDGAVRDGAVWDDAVREGFGWEGAAASRWRSAEACSGWASHSASMAPALGAGCSFRKAARSSLADAGSPDGMVAVLVAHHIQGTRAVSGPVRGNLPTAERLGQLPGAGLGRARSGGFGLDGGGLAELPARRVPRATARQRLASGHFQLMSQTSSSPGWSRPLTGSST